MVAEITKKLPVGQLDVAEVEDWLEQMALKGYYSPAIPMYVSLCIFGRPG